MLLSCQVWINVLCPSGVDYPLYKRYYGSVCTRFSPVHITRYVGGARTGEFLVKAPCPLRVQSQILGNKDGGWSAMTWCFVLFCFCVLFFCRHKDLAAFYGMIEPEHSWRLRSITNVAIYIYIYIFYNHAFSLNPDKPKSSVPLMSNKIQTLSKYEDIRSL